MTSTNEGEDVVLGLQEAMSLDDEDNKNCDDDQKEEIPSLRPRLQSSPFSEAKQQEQQHPSPSDNNTNGEIHQEGDDQGGKLSPKQLDSLQDENLVERDTFDVDSDFEILPDDEELDEDTYGAVDSQVGIEESGADLEKQGENQEESVIVEKEEEEEEQQQQQEEATPKSYESQSPPPSPPLSSSTTHISESTTTTPTSPQGGFFSGLTLSPKGRKTAKIEAQKYSETSKEKPKQLQSMGTAPKSPKSFSALRARTIFAYKNNDTVITTDMPQWMQESPRAQSASSDDSSYDDDTQSTGEDSHIFEDDDMDQAVDFSSLQNFPNSFLGLPPDQYNYLDSDLVKNIGEQDVSKFAREHHLLVKGLLQILAERDHIGVEDDVRDTSNILKMGPLKKRNGQRWFIKYVEIRKGNLTHYDDTLKGGTSSQKTIHLRKRTCTCQARTTKDGSSGGFVFELSVEGRPKLLWMAKSEEARQGWIRAINQAMIGETDDSISVPLDMNLYKNAIDEYESVRSSLHPVKTKKDYVIAVDPLLYHRRSSSALRIPMRWIRDHIYQEQEEMVSDAPHERVRSNISDFWKSLSTTSVVINGFLVEASSAYSGERVIGALSRCILEFDTVEDENNDKAVGGVLNTIKERNADSFVSEVEAVSYARSILSGILRSKVRGDAYAALEELVPHDVASVKPETSEPLHIDVSFAGDDFSQQAICPDDLRSWLPTRLKKSKAWKERFFVISEGVLSFYQKAHPRPSGLRGQLVLGTAEVKYVDDGNIIVIQTKEEERQLRFDDRSEFLKWKAVIDRSTADVSQDDASQRKKKTSALKGATDAGVKLLKGATGKGKRAMAGMKSMGGILARGIRGGHKNGTTAGGMRRRPSTDMFASSTRNLQSKNGKRDPTVQVAVELNSTYKVAPKETRNEEEAWL